MFVVAESFGCSFNTVRSKYVFILLKTENVRSEVVEVTGSAENNYTSV